MRSVRRQLWVWLLLLGSWLCLPRAPLSLWLGVYAAQRAATQGVGNPTIKGAQHAVGGSRAAEGGH
jgi:hypothetical protein